MSTKKQDSTEEEGGGKTKAKEKKLPAEGKKHRSGSRHRARFIFGRVPVDELHEGEVSEGEEKEE